MPLVSVAGAEASIDADAWSGIGRGAAARLAGRDALRGGRALLVTSAHPYRPGSAAGAAVAGRTLPAVQRACHPIGTVGGGITGRASARAASARSTGPSPASDTSRSAGAAVRVRLRGAARRHPKDGAENYRCARAVHGTSSAVVFFIAKFRREARSTSSRPTRRSPGSALPDRQDTTRRQCRDTSTRYIRRTTRRRNVRRPASRTSSCPRNRPDRSDSRRCCDTPASRPCRRSRRRRHPSRRRRLIPAVPPAPPLSPPALPPVPALPPAPASQAACAHASGFELEVPQADSTATTVTKTSCRAPHT